MNINLMAALGQNGELGKNGDLIWRISQDLKNFRHITMGHTLLMGRKTFESIGRPLPGRNNIVLTTKSLDQLPVQDGLFWVQSWPKAQDLALSLKTQELFVIGGGQIYEMMMPFVQRFFLTLIHKEEPQADTFLKLPFELKAQDLSEHHLDCDPPWSYGVLSLI